MCNEVTVDKREPDDLHRQLMSSSCMHVGWREGARGGEGGRGLTYCAEDQVKIPCIVQGTAAYSDCTLLYHAKHT